MKFDTTVAEIIPRTYNVKSFRFARPSSLNFKAGQYMFLSVKVGGKETRKPLSISSSPTEPSHIECTKKITEHPFSKRLNDLKLGEAVTVEAPLGNFTFEGESERIGLLSGGVGITPLRSICKYCTDMKLKTKVTLLYGNKTEADIAFREDFEQMQKQYKSLKVVLALAEPEANWKGYTGYINAEMIRKEIPDYRETLFYVCGPPEMVQAMESILNTMDVPVGNVKKENFTGY